MKRLLVVVFAVLVLGLALMPLFAVARVKHHAHHYKAHHANRHHHHHRTGI